MLDVLVFPKRSRVIASISPVRSDSSVLGMIVFYPKTHLRNERMRTQKKDMALGLEELRKLMEYTSL